MRISVRAIGESLFSQSGHTVSQHQGFKQTAFTNIHLIRCQLSPRQDGQRPKIQAPLKDPCAKEPDTIRYCQLRQSGTVLEGVGVQLRTVSAQRHACQPGAIPERSLTNVRVQPEPGE